ncbi:DUF3313 domain-containing protein [Pseudomonas sp. QL9]|uniref:Lipoprotein n=1 Tax=Pseudomonas knackmussii (strain DSM 6978 / CCUG 54928 / LMG 23759 / B13) TaxID=1301098 RepID=A0A024HER6_PSEKB|nr:DUF3313 domain-containing protein [Pseudomonas knackmussii]CDF83555.1 Protein of unknown function (DUF3313) [Pseudomonas knackmussii B13]
MKKYAVLVPLLVLPLLFGCSSNKVAPEDYSGFLGDYSRLTEQENASGTKVQAWIDPNLNLTRYTSVYIEPTQYFPKPNPTDKISQQTLDQISAYYNQVLKREFGQVLRVVDQPVTDTLVVRAAITGVSSHTQSLHAYEVIPIALIAAGVSTATGIRDQDTVIATEAAFIDGGNSKVVAEVVRKGTGHPLENSSQALTANDLKGVLDGWAKDMRLSYTKLRTLK